jgi:hypothetical protein
MDPSVQQAFAQQQQQIQQLQQQLQAAVAQVAAAAAAAPQAAPHAPAPRPQEPRLPPPPRFDGAGATLDAWIAEMQRQFAYNHTAADADRLRIASAFLGIAATNWWAHYPAPKPATWDAFVIAIRAHFQPVTLSSTTRNKLACIRQGRRSVHVYIAAFRELLDAVPTMHADDRLAFFLRGLEPEISKALHLHGVATLETAIAMATRHGSIGEHLAAANHGASAAAAGRAGAPMDLDAIEGLEGETDEDAPITRAQMMQMLNAMREERKSPHAGGAGGGGRGRFRPFGPPRMPHLTPEQVKAYMDAGKCFGCGSTDHRSRQCPKRKVGADGKVSWGN